MGFEFYKEHTLSETPDYKSVLHEMRDEQGNQMLVIHMDTDPSTFAPSVLKRMVKEFYALRSCTDAPIFAIEPNPDDAKWERYVSHMGFEYSSRGVCSDGLTRRCFVSKKKNNDHE
jgi:hypothetical protein